jgi:polyhydroxybutyrate depolymerase
MFCHHCAFASCFPSLTQIYNNEFSRFADTIEMLGFLLLTMNSVVFGQGCKGDSLYTLPTIPGKNLTALSSVDTRRIDLYSPSNITESQLYPLVLLLHASNSGPHIIAEYFQSGIQSVPFYVVVPEGRRDEDGCRGWNAEFRMNRWGSSPPDDIGFLNNLVDSVISTNRNIDRSKVFIVGFSNGGFMTNQLVCFNASRYAGIVNVVGSAPRDVASCKPGTAVSVLHARGTSDDIVLYDGTVGVPSPHFDGPTVVRNWATINQCSNQSPIVGKNFEYQIGKGLHASPFVYQGCPEGVKVEFWRLEGSPHNPSPTVFAQQRIFQEFLGSITKSNATTIAIQNSASKRSVAYHWYFVSLLLSFFW